MSTESSAPPDLPTGLAIPGLYDATLRVSGSSGPAAVQTGRLTFGAAAPFPAEPGQSYAVELIPEEQFGVFMYTRRGDHVSQNMLAQRAHLAQSAISEAEAGITALRIHHAAAVYEALGGRALHLLFLKADRATAPGPQRVLGVGLSAAASPQTAIGALLKKTRTDQGASQTKLAAMTETTQAMVSYVETAYSATGRVRAVRMRTVCRCFASLGFQVVYGGLPASAALER